MSLRTVYDEREIDAQLAGVCGMYCGACPVYRAWVEQDRIRLGGIAREIGTPMERVLCTGCRSVAPLCFGGDCPIRRCAEARGVPFCADCDLFPCAFQDDLLSHAPRCRGAREGTRRIREVGWYAWLREEDARWRCPECRAKVGQEEEACRTCGRSLRSQ